MSCWIWLVEQCGDSVFLDDLDDESALATTAAVASCWVVDVPAVEQLLRAAAAAAASLNSCCTTEAAVMLFVAATGVALSSSSFEFSDIAWVLGLSCGDGLTAASSFTSEAAVTADAWLAARGKDTSSSPVMVASNLRMKYAHFHIILQILVTHHYRYYDHCTML